MVQKHHKQNTVYFQQQRSKSLISTNTVNNKKMDDKELVIQLAPDTKVSVGPCDVKICSIRIHGIPCSVPGAEHAACMAPRQPDCAIRLCLGPIHPEPPVKRLK